MSDTHEDVRLSQQPLPPHYGNIDAQRIHACARQLQQALAAYEALGSVEYLAALVEEHEAYTANLEALEALFQATRDEVNEAAERNRETNAIFVAAHDEAEEVLRNE